jgi:hypothetical protein
MQQDETQYLAKLTKAFKYDRSGMKRDGSEV